MHNPFAKKESASNLALSFETKSAVMPEVSESMPLSKKIELLRSQANALEQKLEQDLTKIWAYFDERKDDYYSGKELSYSFLKHVDSIRFNTKTFGDKEYNFALGRAFEDMLCGNLDLRKYKDLTTDDFLNLQRMCEVAKKDAWIKVCLEDFEQQKVVRGTIKGFRFIGKLDFFNRELDCVLDLKSTSAKTFGQFEKACIDFGYYTQGVIYTELSLVESIEDFYIIAGVSKKKDAVFTVSMNEQACEIGWKEFNRLIENLEYYGISEHFKV